MTEEQHKRLAIIASHGTMDAAYPPLVLSTAAAAMDMEAAIFFTFYGLNIVKKGGIDSLQVAPLANPAMPMPVPNIVGMLPGMTAMATSMMKGMMNKAHVAKLSEASGNRSRVWREAHRLPDDDGRDGRQERGSARGGGIGRRRHLPGVRQPQRHHAELLGCNAPPGAALLGAAA